MQFNTELVLADWDDISNAWRLKLSTGETWTVRYLVTALGLLSKANYPDIPGIKTFKGQMCHTAAWPQGLDVTGKRVGVIGCGSTGVQVITDVAKRVKSLTCFQRHPQYSVPSGDRPVEPAYREEVNKRYDSIFDQVKNSQVGFGFVESTVPFKSINSPEERDAIFETLWNQGNGFRFMFGGFNDIATDKEANEAACQFIRQKIAHIVKDPEKVRKLQPHDYYARRPLCDGGYFEQFNRPNVDVVALQEVDSRGRTDDPFALLTKAVGNHSVDARSIVTEDGDYGQVLLSRWPFAEPPKISDVSYQEREPRRAIAARILSNQLCGEG